MWQHKFTASHYGVKIWCWEKSFRVEGSPDFFYTGEVMTPITAQSYCKKLSNIILTAPRVQTNMIAEIDMLKARLQEQDLELQDLEAQLMEATES